MPSLALLVPRLQNLRVAVIGDVMLDHFIVGHVDRISPEAPVPVVRFDREDYRLGGAANVANNIASLGGRVSLVGLVGTDEASRELARTLEASGLDAAHLVSDARPTTRKVRVVTTRNQQVARVDYEGDGEPEGAALAALRDRVAAVAHNCDIVVLSDYRKGVVSQSIVELAAASAAASGVPVLVDPKVPRAERYRGAALVTPNHHEAELMTAIAIRSPEDARQAARTIHERSGANVLITWGEHGMWLLDASQQPWIEEAMPAAAREVADVTGAGDTVVAVLALSLAAGASLVDAARLANIAAGLVVARFGPAVIALDELATAVAERQS
jgi:D-beta-D-heptose 7-phosphate kinase/D-beta-D-heptose 1-phosphate adenosyltransferase